MMAIMLAKPMVLGPAWQPDPIALGLAAIPDLRSLGIDDS